MYYHTLLNRAMEIAITAHHKQTDRHGESYLGHVFRVMQMGKTIDEKICGVLHDVVEDSAITFEQLKEAGFPQHIIDALICLTKESENEDYNHFIDRIVPNNLAIRVKINDLTDNMDIRRLRTVKEEDIDRLNKYLNAYHRLTDTDII